MDVCWEGQSPVRRPRVTGATSRHAVGHLGPCPAASEASPRPPSGGNTSPGSSIPPIMISIPHSNSEMFRIEGHAGPRSGIRSEPAERSAGGASRSRVSRESHPRAVRRSARPGRVTREGRGRRGRAGAGVRLSHSPACGPTLSSVARLPQTTDTAHVESE